MKRHTDYTQLCKVQQQARRGCTALLTESCTLLSVQREEHTYSWMCAPYSGPLSSPAPSQAAIKALRKSNLDKVMERYIQKQLDFLDVLSHNTQILCAEPDEVIRGIAPEIMRSLEHQIS